MIHEFNINIQASPERVWNTLWEDQNYRAWTAVFYPGSHTEGELVEGGRIKFLSPEKDGMIAEIRSCKPPLEMKFRHIGMIDKGKEILEGSMIEQWGNALEEYYLTPSNNGTALKIVLEMQAVGDVVEDLLKAWPKALDKVKELAEA